MDLETKIKKQVGWLNYNAGLSARISCSDVLPGLLQVESTQAMKILKDVERAASTITDPTAYVLKAINNAGGADVGRALNRSVVPPRGGQFSLNKPPAMQPVVPALNSSVGLDPTKKIGRQVGWLNQHVELKEKISFSDVIEPLSRIDVTAAMKILKDVEECASRIERPTSYIAAAASRLAPATNAVVPFRDVAQGQKRTWSQATAAHAAPNTSPEGDDDKKIARQVGWLNQHCSLPERISYSDVKEPLGELDLRTALRLLKDVENMKQKVRNPTSFLISAAKREAAQGNVRGGPSDIVQAAVECWDFQQGHCPRGDKCRYAHNGISPSALGGISDSAALAQALGLTLSNQALLELSSIPSAEAEEVLQEIASGEKAISSTDHFIAKICSRIRAEAHKEQSGGGGGEPGGIVKRLRQQA